MLGHALRHAVHCHKVFDRMPLLSLMNIAYIVHYIISLCLNVRYYDTNMRMYSRKQKQRKVKVQLTRDGCIVYDAINMCVACVCRMGGGVSPNPPYLRSTRPIFIYS